jgi:hypothetical protein
MPSQHLASIHLTWDDKGNTRHRVTSPLKLTDYQVQDGLALSVPLLFASQLGVLRPMHSLRLCSEITDFLGATPLATRPIDPPLVAARIDLHKKDQTVVCTFFPDVTPSGQMDIEIAICRLITNYITHVHASVQDQLRGFMTQMLAPSLVFFLENALPAAGGSASRDPSASYPRVQAAMLQFSWTIYPRWGGKIPEDRFRSLVKSAQLGLKEARAQWGV